ncbi:hypothetical protein J1614_002012 [Plenodomus biglobosus]|nr:hypothetical protein J1614_002012 [Plenodomus biglobosus]
MFFQYLLGCLFLYHGILALSLPHYTKQQQPLLSSEQPSPINVDSDKGSVMLGYKESGSDEEKAIEIPMRTRIPAGADLPVHPKMMRVLTASNNMGQAISVEKLGSIVCRLEPKWITDGTAAVELAMGRMSWPGFSLQDNRVEFERSDSKWFLGGTAVSAYECW